MTTDLDSLMANLSASDRDRLNGALAADPELATGLCTMLADLPARTQERMMRRLPGPLGEPPAPRGRAARGRRSHPRSRGRNRSGDGAPGNRAGIAPADAPRAGGSDVQNRR